MSLGQLIVYLIIALICGLLGQALVRRSIGGYLVSTLVGLGGGIVGGYLGRLIHAPDPLILSVGNRSIPLLWTIAGAALLTLLVSLVQRSRRSWMAR